MTAKRATTGDDVSRAVAPPRARKGRSAATKAQPRRANGRFVDKLTRKLIAEVCSYVEQGAAAGPAAARAGIPLRTFWSWIARGRNGSGTVLERELAEAVLGAEERMLADGAISLWNADDWRAKLAVMERRRPAEWGPPEKRVQHAGRIALVHEGDLTPERLRSALDSGEFSAGEIETAIRFLRWVRGQAGEVIDGKALELEAGEDEAEAEEAEAA